MKIIREIDWEGLSDEFCMAKPYNHIVIDDFFLPEYAERIADQFPGYDDDLWYTHNNVVEVKKLVNHWDRFPPETYQAFSYFCSNDFIDKLQKLTKGKLYADHGLNGGGWHIHKNGGKLNIHKDYSIHPKLGLQRKLNLIVYMTKDWKPEFGGALELWSHNAEKKGPLKKEKAVEFKFNRAVIFDTSQNSWHGLPEPLNMPEGVCRKTVAAYFLTDPVSNADTHQRALFAPTEEQIGDEYVEEFIKKRAEWKYGKLWFGKNGKINQDV